MDGSHLLHLYAVCSFSCVVPLLWMCEDGAQSHGVIYSAKSSIVAVFHLSTHPSMWSPFLAVLHMCPLVSRRLAVGKRQSLAEWSSAACTFGGRQGKTDYLFLPLFPFPRTESQVCLSNTTAFKR